MLVFDSIVTRIITFLENHGMIRILAVNPECDTVDTQDSTKFLFLREDKITVEIEKDNDNNYVADLACCCGNPY